MISLRSVLVVPSSPVSLSAVNDIIIVLSPVTDKQRVNLQLAFISALTSS